MKVITCPKQMQALALQYRQECVSTALVPTMGNLHIGHLHLIKIAKQKAQKVIASIYVNPTQFGANEDFSTYPRTPESDLSQLESLETDYVFMPSHDALYPAGHSEFTQIQCPALDQMLCSTTRPHFFTGVATVVLKLINICHPNFAYFGDKDFQQLQVIRRTCKELFIPTNILSCPIIRAESGLALSSRNAYLSGDELEVAPQLFGILSDIKKEIESKPHMTEKPAFIQSLEEHAKLALVDLGFKIDYLDVIDANTLSKSNFGHELRIAAACYLGSTRLIDNLEATRS